MSDRSTPELSTESSPNYRRGGGRRAEAKSSGGAGRQIGTNLIMAILLGGLVLAGWFIANQQQMLAEEQERLTDANQRLQSLENRLSATDSALSQGGQDTSQKINFWESEIRKLWAVSNDRNKKWIEGNQAAVKKLNGTLNGIVSSNRDLKAGVSRHEKAFAQQQTLVDGVASLELQMQQIARGQRDLVDKVNGANQAVASLRASIAGKVEDNSEAIASMDAYRVAVNSRLADIERRLTAVGGGAAQ